MDFTIIVAVVVGLTEVFKWVFKSARWTPVFAIFMGILLSLISPNPIGAQIVVGLVAGLTAIGAYKVGTTTILGDTLSKRLKIKRD